MLGPLFSAAEMQIAHVSRKICPASGKNTAQGLTPKLAADVPVFYYPPYGELKTCIEFEFAGVQRALMINPFILRLSLLTD